MDDTSQLHRSAARARDSRPQRFHSPGRSARHRQYEPGRLAGAFCRLLLILLTRWQYRKRPAHAIARLLHSLRQQWQRRSDHFDQWKELSAQPRPWHAVPDDGIAGIPAQLILEENINETQPQSND